MYDYDLVCMQVLMCDLFTVNMDSSWKKGRDRSCCQKCSILLASSNFNKVMTSRFLCPYTRNSTVHTKLK